MYANLFPRYGSVSRRSILVLATLSVAQLAGLQRLQAQQPETMQPASVIRNISRANERIEMTVNTSQVLTLQNPIPRIQVTNPELLTATPLSKNEVQIAARQSGVTQVNLWDETGRVYTVDIIIYGDVRELDMTLKQMFPESSIRAVRLSQSLVLQGQVDRPEIVPTISRLAEDYAPKVINAITVGGVQQITLKVKVMEVNRTKLRKLGFEFDYSGSGGGFLNSFLAGLDTASNTIDFGIVNGGESFDGFLDALQQNNLLKTLADPVLTTVSGRPASFNVGGEAYFTVSGISGNSLETVRFGTQVDFVPIVLGNGQIRLEVRPKISEIDLTPGDNVAFQTKVSEVDTGVEMQAGQTLALAGLVQQRVRAQHRGLPFISDLPVIGIPFRSVSEEVDEIELLVLVTPEFVDAMDPHEVPMCGPGMESVSPSHLDLYCKGYIEVPACGPCGPGMGTGCNACANGACNVHGGAPMGMPATATDGPQLYTTPPDGSSYPVMPETAPLPAPSSSGGGEQLYDPSASTATGSPHYYTAQLPMANQAQVRGINPAYQHILSNQAQQPGQPATHTPGLIGPIGYDVQK